MTNTAAHILNFILIANLGEGAPRGYNPPANVVLDHIEGDRMEADNLLLDLLLGGYIRRQAGSAGLRVTPKGRMALRGALALAA